MRKTGLITAALVALTMLLSCQKDRITGTGAQAAGVTRFTATILQTKTAIDSLGKVTWREGDEITVTDASENTAVFVAESSGASTSFTLKEGESPLGSGPYSAVYGDLHNQVYDAHGANCPLKAEPTDSTNFKFSSPYAVLRITAKSEVPYSIGNITVTCDTLTLAFLNCGSSVELSADSTVFYAAVEPGIYEELKITFNSAMAYAVKTRTSPIALSARDLLPLTLSLTSDDWQSACVAAGTMITMEDGSRKAVEELAVGDKVRTFDHKKGEISSAPVCYVWESRNVAKAFTLTFEGGTEVTVIEEHGFYDKEEGKYAFINARNVKDCIGHHFYDADNGRWLELKSCRILNKGLDAYAIVTSGHLDHLSNGMLSVCDGAVKIWANLFEYDDCMRYDAARKAADIEKYGLTPLEKVLEYEGFSETDYYDYNLQYLNVAVGKGLTSWERIKSYSDYCVAYLNH